MKVIIAGCREISDYDAVASAIESCNIEIDTVLSGGCRGVDLCGEQWAADHQILIEKYPAEWHLFGRAAGIIRNQKMVDSADALIAIISTKYQGRGTASIIKMANKKGLPVYVREIS